MKDDAKNILETLLTTSLTVATVPQHPYNAKFLDKLISIYSMPERDVLWSTHIHSSENSEGAVNRLIDWGLLISPDMELEEDVAELASIALAWMLTSSNRFVRDRATKALVSVLTGRLDTLHKILKRFAGVNDLYVAERLYAVAYGVAMRSHDVEKVGDVAQWVYDNVFADGRPPAHILLRDYARGVVERALYLGAKINVDRDLIEPPYTSEFPYIPTEEEINEFMVGWGEASHDKGEVEWSRNRIRESVMGGIIEGDFARYVIGTNIGKLSGDWSSLKLCETERQLAEVVMERPEKPSRFELKKVQRYVFKRVFDLGWTVERFGQFDVSIKYRGRTATKEERIGKKYQWIAYHEIMAYISDHYQYLEGYNRVGKYEGPWRDNTRDIDPSVTLSSNKGKDDLDGHKSSWWARETYTAWKEDDSHDAWMEVEDDMPATKKMMSVRDRDNINWLNLRGSFVWEQSSSLDKDRRELWISFTGCFVRNNDVEEFTDWAGGLDPAESDILMPPEVNGAFFGEYDWSPAFKSIYGRNCDKPGPLDECPVDAYVAAFGCSYGHKGFDCSVDHNAKTTFLVPHFDPIEQLKLKWEGRNAEFVDTEGKLVAYDPTATEEGPESLLFREDLLKRYLKDNELTLCWLVRGERRVLYSDVFDIADNAPLWRVIYGRGVLEDDGPQVELKFSDISRNPPEGPPRPPSLVLPDTSS